MQDIRPHLNEILDFMLDNELDIPKFTLQHVVEHFHSIGEELSLPYVTSLLDTHVSEGNVEVDDSEHWMLTKQGRVLAQIGGYTD
jgi:hypothetical protein